MHEIERLLSVLRRVPILVVDEGAARRRGDQAALAYAAAIKRWQDDAARALAEVDEPAGERPNAFERILLAADRARIPAANVNLPA